MRNHRLHKFSGMAAGCLAVLSIGSISHAGVYTPVDSSYKLTFDEEFNGSSVDTSKWGLNWFGSAGAVTGPIAGGETAAYDPAQATVSGGYLRLKAISSPVTVNGKSYAYRSGMVTSNGKFQQTYGYFEARIFMPGKNGIISNWPAFWTDGQNWPYDGEMDVVEGLSGQAGWHFHSPSGGPGANESGDYTGWHVFAALWEPGVVTYFYDGNQVGKISSGITTSPMYLILNHGVGGAGGPTEIPAEMLVDYVHVYSKDAGAKAVTPQPNYGGPGATGGASPTPTPTPAPTPVPPSASPSPTPISSRTTIQTASPSSISTNPGKQVNVTYRFDAQKMDRNYKVFVHFVDASGATVFQDDHEPPTATTSWSGAVSYTRTITVPSTVATGPYKILAGLFDLSSPTWARATLNAGTGVIAGSDLRYQIGTMNVSQAVSNLVQNPGFESGATSWSKYGSTYITGIPRSGANAARIDGMGGFEQTVSGLKPYTSYTLSAYVRSLKGNRIAIGAKNFGGNQVAVDSASGSYTKLSLSFTTGNSTSALIFLYQDSGSAVGDDFSLTQNP